jgi:hypothetical protein
MRSTNRKLWRSLQSGGQERFSPENHLGSIPGRHFFFSATCQTNTKNTSHFRKKIDGIQIANARQKFFFFVFLDLENRGKLDFFFFLRRFFGKSRSRRSKMSIPRKTCPETALAVLFGRKIQISLFSLTTPLPPTHLLPLAPLILFSRSLKFVFYFVFSRARGLYFVPSPVFFPFPPPPKFEFGAPAHGARPPLSAPSHPHPLSFSSANRGSCLPLPFARVLALFSVRFSLRAYF